MSGPMRQKQKKLRAEERSMHRDRTSLGLSLLLHACVLGVLALLVRPIAPAAEQTNLVAMGRITIIHRPPPPEPIRHVTSARRAMSAIETIALTPPLHQRA